MAGKVDKLIESVMSSFPNANLAYYEEVHQHLAPFARDLERENDALKAELAEVNLKLDGK